MRRLVLLLGLIFVVVLAIVVGNRMCMFRAKSTTDSDASCPVIPVDVVQRFRCMPTTN